MRPEIEARFLGLEWLERGRARRVEVAPDPLEVEIGLDGVLRVETQIFNDFHPWLGLRLSGRLERSTPVFVDAQGQELPMLAVDDGTGGPWWVQDDGWDAVQQRHLSELHRTMGRFEVRIDDRRLLIENLATGLGQAQLDEYLQDFKHDLIWLVLSSGAATIAGAGTFFGDELPAALSDFVSAVARVGSRPARALREISAETRRSRLRPNAASFRQHARRPASLRLVGRASEETVDTADNRYLRHLVQVCDRLALSADQAAKQQADRFAARARFEDERGTLYGATTSRQVNPEMFDRQLAELTAKLDRLAAWSDAEPDEQSCDLQDYRLEITGRYGGRGDEFFYKKPEGRSESDEKYDIQYNVVRLPKVLCDLVVAAQSFCKVYTLTGTATITRKRNSKDKWFRHVAFSRVVVVNPDRQAIEAKLRTRTRLESRGWQHDLSRAEREEMKHEARTAASRAETYRRFSGQARVAASELASCRAALRQQDTHWQSRGVLQQSAFPMGMRYVLSPDYAAVLNAFTRVRLLAQRAGVGDESLDELNRISILHASAVYERWCLVKIIGVLIEEFAFQPSPGWQELVIRAVTGRPDSTNLVFHRRDLGVSAILEVQPVLENGRRPDFRLRFDGADSVEVGAIVMDAKFRTRWRRGELADLLADLVDGKRYGGERDRVFVLQPQANTISEPTSPLRWGHHCDYGQDAPTNHRVGSIQLAAGAQEGGAQDNLRRLIAMGLQAAFPTPSSLQDNGRTNSSCCVHCGTRHEPSDIAQLTTRGGKDYWSFGCSHCGMVSVRTHCYACDAIIYKNGIDLTYHRTLADQIMNVMCPSCGRYFDHDFSDG
jgi:pyrethroid hydrolase